MNAENKNEYNKLTGGATEKFQSIIGLLTNFDSKTGRWRKYSNPETHFMRRAISLANPDDLIVLIKKIDTYTYRIVVRYVSDHATLSIAWTLEDGIAHERSEYADLNHPVHGITCLTDIYDSDESLGALIDDIDLNIETRRLLI